MGKPVLRVALADSQETAVVLIDSGVADLAFYLHSNLTYCICKFSTEEMLPRIPKLSYQVMGDWSTAFPIVRQGRFERSFARLYKRWTTYERMIAQLKEHFEVVEVKIE